MVENDSFAYFVLKWLQQNFKWFNFYFKFTKSTRSSWLVWLAQNNLINSYIIIRNYKQKLHIWASNQQWPRNNPVLQHDQHFVLNWNLELNTDTLIMITALKDKNSNSNSTIQLKEWKTILTFKFYCKFLKQLTE